MTSDHQRFAATLLCAAALAGGGVVRVVHAAGWQWTASASPGYDTFVQSYALALEDTVESVSEYDLTLGAEGRTPDGARHGWTVQPRLSAGSERLRGQLDWEYVLRPDELTPVLRVAGSAQAVRYNDGTTYNLSSDHAEGALSARWQLARGGAAAWEARASAATLRYADPSELEPRRDDWTAGFAAVSTAGFADRWRAGLKYGQRAYPDTTEIDRATLGLDVAWSHDPLEGWAWRFDGRSERRRVRVSAVRPSAWSHALDAEVSAPAGALRLVAAGLLESWRYDDEWGAYADQTRLETRVTVRVGDILGPTWELGAVRESLASHAAGESYRQWGACGALENFGKALTVMLSLEVGRRDYDEAGGDDPLGALYTDFTYVEVGLNLSWALTDRLRLDGMAQYLPESHAADEDDQSLGFGSLRLGYRF
jgi:hypothetical protein